jgi:hypothetical protein
MAQELISDIVLQSAQDQLTKLENSLEANYQLLVKATEQALKFNDAIGKGGGSSGGGGRSGTSTQIDEMEKLKRQIDSYNDKIAAQKTLIGQLHAEQKLMYQDAVKGNKDYVKSLDVVDGSLEHMEKQMAAAKKELWGMNDAMLKSARGKELIEHYKKLNTEVGSLEQKMGIFRRNVGNYASGFNAMGNSVAQIARELPNFAQSMQIGIMSLTNNIGAFQDAIGQIKKGNEQLKADGKPVKSVLGEISASFFSLNTLVMLGVTALTMYGPKLWEMAKGAKAAAGDLDALTDALVKGKQAATEEVNELDMLYKITQDTTKSIEDRRLAVDKLQLLYPAYFKNIEDEKILNGEATSSYYALRNSIYEVAKAQALKGKLAEIINEGLEEEGRLLRELKKAQATEEADRGKAITLRPSDAMSSKSQSTILNMSVSESDADRALRVANARAALAEFQANEQKKTALLREQIEQRMGIMLKYEETTGGDTSTSAIRRAGKNKAIQSKEELEKDSEEYQSALEWHDNEVFIMNQSADQRLYEDIRKGWERRNKLLKEKLKEEMELIKGNLDAIDTMTDDNAENRKRISEIAKNISDRVMVVNEVLTSISEAMVSQANMYADQQIENIDRVEQAQLDSLSRLTLADSEREEEKKRIELAAKARRDAIEVDRIKKMRRAAIFQKGLDSAAIIANTARAMSQHNYEVPFPANIPVLISDAALGAAQLIKVLSTPLPQYAKGTPPGGHKGGLAIVGEEGRELGELPDGKLFLTNDKPTIMDLPARTRITPADATKKMMRDVLFNMDSAGNVKEGVDATQLAILGKFEEMNEDIKGLRRDLQRKELAVTFLGDTGHITRINNAFKRRG